ncbi:hypothetical protein KRMM14A1004_21700 [Krasilnikovia sp. MM14-A1004]
MTGRSRGAAAPGHGDLAYGTQLRLPCLGGNLRDRAIHARCRSAGVRSSGSSAMPLVDTEKVQVVERATSPECGIVAGGRCETPTRTLTRRAGAAAIAAVR